MKYRIITTAGIRKAKDPVPFRFSSPKWLAKMKFFTNRYASGGTYCGFTVTETSTGMEICRRGFKTRNQAKSHAKHMFLQCASLHGVSAINKIVREHRLSA